MIDDNNNIPPSKDNEEDKSTGTDIKNNDDLTDYADDIQDVNVSDNNLTEQEGQANESEQITGEEKLSDTDNDWSDKKVDKKKLLNQSEVDRLLGDVASVNENKGSKNILFSKEVYHERLPMLEVVFDRLVRIMSTTLRNFSSTNVDVSLSKITSIRFGDYLNSIPQPAMIGVFKAVEWDNHGLIFINNDLIYSIVDVLLGNRKGQIIKIEGRPYTTIERHLMERMMKTIIHDLKNSFEPIAPITFLFERLETNPSFAVVARESNAAILIKMNIFMDDRSGIAEILLPYATIEPIRELLLQNFMGEKFGHDSIWETHLASSLWGTQIDVQATFPKTVGLLYDVLNWKVGTKISLNCSPSDPIQVKCGNHFIASGKMGQKKGKIAIRLDKIIQGSLS